MRQVLRLELETWDGQLRSWRRSQLVRPSWNQVEDSIRGLDPASRPGLTIVMNEDGVPDNCLWIKGGNEKYLIGGTTGNDRWVHFFDPNIEWNRKTTVWTADEGFTAYEGEVVTGMELVVQIAKHFVAHNVFLPDLPWRVESEPSEPPTEEVREVLAFLPTTRQVTMCFTGGPLGGSKLDSRSTTESEQWDVAWLLVKTRDGQLGARFSMEQWLKSRGGLGTAGEYEIRGRSANATERHFDFVYNG